MQPMANIALTAARKAGQIILRAIEEVDTLAVETKAMNDYVSEVDRAAEREAIYHIHKAYPDHDILGEESGLVKGRESTGEYTWIIDPLDGTTNFLRGIPQYAVSIACMHKGKIEHAAIFDPIKDESFTASRGYGARLNNKRLRVSNRKSLDGALLGTGIPFNSTNLPRLEAYMGTLQELASQTAGIRRAGAASLDLAYVAAGRLDGFWETGLQQWDIAAGVLLVTEAGGLVSDFKGGENYLESGNIVCGSPKCFKEILKVVNQKMGDV